MSCSGAVARVAGAERIADWGCCIGADADCVYLEGALDQAAAVVVAGGWRGAGMAQAAGLEKIRCLVRIAHPDRPSGFELPGCRQAFGGSPCVPSRHAGVGACLVG